MDRVYLDCAASTPVDPEVFRAMTPYFSEKFGNPGSLHSFGQEAIAAVDRSREAIAKILGVEFREIVFTGSATEANNLALRGAVKAFRMKGKTKFRIVVSSIEHESILETAKDLGEEGAEVIYIPVDKGGVVDKKKIKESLTPETAIVSVMYGNNEIGTIEPVEAIAEAVKEFRGKNNYPLFHTDAAQAFRFFPCEPKKLGIDLMTLSSHKIYGPKGAGALYVRDIKEIAPAISGGGQEFGMRSGTENVPAIVGFAKAAELVSKIREKETRKIEKLRDQFESGLRALVPQMEVHGEESSAPKLPHILNVYFRGKRAEDLLTKFDLAGLAASSGSACRSRAATSSYVIESLGYPKERALASIRFSFGRETSEADVARALDVIRTAL